MPATAILVLYRERLEHSASFQSLLDNHQWLIDHGLHLLIHDNSPEPQAPPTNLGALPVEYHHAPDNPGLAAAYNRALERAQGMGHDWLLLLDQDTRLSAAYFNEVSRYLDQVSADCVALVPRISDGRRQVSPMDCTSVRARIPNRHSGYLEGSVTAINSGTWWRIGWLRELGGFSAQFPLDYLDHWACLAARKAGKRLYLLDCEIRQNLSISRPSTVSVQRYRCIYEAEYRFYRKYRTDLFDSYRRHLLLRLGKQLACGRLSTARLTLQLLARRAPSVTSGIH
ncbi:MAG: hypothetical protein GAK43_02332 [Stenotrophomonas maltophilia]|nr:MAG: hypothetical protein GAK43_02332 [Stenotrophomonas maltophilia]